MDEYVDTYDRLISTTTPYDRLQALANGSEKLLALSETLGTLLVNGSLGYKLTSVLDGENKTRIWFRGSGFSAQFGKLHKFFDYGTWYDQGANKRGTRFVDLRTASAHRHGCFDGPPCFSDTQDRLDVLTRLMSRLFKKLGVCSLEGTDVTDISRLISHSYNRIIPTSETPKLETTPRISKSP